MVLIYGTTSLVDYYMFLENLQLENVFLKIVIVIIWIVIVRIVLINFLFSLFALICPLFPLTINIINCCQQVEIEKFQKRKS